MYFIKCCCQTDGGIRDCLRQRLVKTPAMTSLNAQNLIFNFYDWFFSSRALGRISSLSLGLNLSRSCCCLESPPTRKCHCECQMSMSRATARRSALWESPDPKNPENTNKLATPKRDRTEPASENCTSRERVHAAIYRVYYLQCGTPCTRHAPHVWCQNSIYDVRLMLKIITYLFAADTRFCHVCRKGFQSNATSALPQLKASPLSSAISSGHKQKLFQIPINLGSLGKNQKK